MKIYQLLFFTVLFFGLESQAQNQAETTNNWQAQIHFSTEVNSFRTLHINHNLESAGLPNFKKRSFGLSFGGTVFYKKHAATIEGGQFGNRGNEANGFKSSYKIETLNIEYLFNLFKTDKSKFYLGIGYRHLDFDGNILVINKGSTNLANLNNNAFFGNFNLNTKNHAIGLHIWFVPENFNGMSIKSSFFQDFSQNYWESENVNLINSFNEDFSHFSLSFIIPIKSWDKL